jgi:ribosomal protein L44E
LIAGIPPRDTFSTARNPQGRGSHERPKIVGYAKHTETLQVSAGFPKCGRRLSESLRAFYSAR